MRRSRTRISRRSNDFASETRRSAHTSRRTFLPEDPTSGAGSSMIMRLVRTAGSMRAIGGEVSIDVSSVLDNSQKTIQKAQQICRAALALVDPSGAG